MKFAIYLITTVLLFASSISFGQTNIKAQDSVVCMYNNDISTLGMGLVLAPDSFEVYNDSLLLNPYQRLIMHYNGNKAKFCPKFYKPDYGIMHFVCIGITNKAYKIIVNYSNVKYLPRKKQYEFRTWRDYIMNSNGIDKITDNASDADYSILYKGSSENSDTIKVPHQASCCPVEMKGDWVKVVYNCFIDGPCDKYLGKCQNPLTGWIQWRKGNKLLINIFLME